MAKPRITAAAVSDLAMGANSASRAVMLYRDAAALSEQDSSRVGDQSQPGALKRLKIEEAVGQAVLACRFLVQFIQRHGGKVESHVAHEIETQLGGSDPGTDDD